MPKNKALSWDKQDDHPHSSTAHMSITQEM